MSTSLPAQPATATKEARFATHLTDTQRIFLCSDTKTAPLAKTLGQTCTNTSFTSPAPLFAVPW